MRRAHATIMTGKRRRRAEHRPPYHFVSMDLAVSSAPFVPAQPGGQEEHGGGSEVQERRVGQQRPDEVPHESRAAFCSASIMRARLSSSSVTSCKIFASRASAASSLDLVCGPSAPARCGPVAPGSSGRASCKPAVWACACALIWFWARRLKSLRTSPESELWIGTPSVSSDDVAGHLPQCVGVSLRLGRIVSTFAHLGAQADLGLASLVEQAHSITGSSNTPIETALTSFLSLTPTLARSLMTASRLTLALWAVKIASSARRAGSDANIPRYWRSGPWAEDRKCKSTATERADDGRLNRLRVGFRHSNGWVSPPRRSRASLSRFPWP